MSYCCCCCCYCSHLLKFVCKHQLYKIQKARIYSLHIHFFFSPVHSIPICLIVRQLLAEITTPAISMPTILLYLYSNSSNDGNRTTATPSVSLFAIVQVCVCVCAERASIYLHDNLNCLLMLFSSIWIDRPYANNNK